jgi:hypothetical protein
MRELLYLDSTAMVKRYIEPGSGAVKAFNSLLNSEPHRLLIAGYSLIR